MRCEILTHTLLVLTVLWRSLPPRSTPIVSLWSLCWHRQVQPERHPLRSLYTWLHTRCIGMPDSVYSELQDSIYFATSRIMSTISAWALSRSERLYHNVSAYGIVQSFTILPSHLGNNNNMLLWKHCFSICMVWYKSDRPHLLMGYVL